MDKRTFILYDITTHKPSGYGWLSNGIFHIPESSLSSAGNSHIRFVDTGTATKRPKATKTQRKSAKQLLRAGMPVPEIHELTNVPKPTLYLWRRKLH